MDKTQKSTKKKAKTVTKEDVFVLAKASLPTKSVRTVDGTVFLNSSVGKVKKSSVDSHDFLEEVK